MSKAPSIFPKAKKIHGHIEYIILSYLPLSTVDSPQYHRWSKYLPLSSTIFLKYILLLVDAVTEKIRQELPPKFSLEFAKFSAMNETNYTCMFAVYSTLCGVRRRVLLAIYPLYYEYSLTTDNHAAAIVTTLQSYGKGVENITYIVGDRTGMIIGITISPSFFELPLNLDLISPYFCLI